MSDGETVEVVVPYTLWRGEHAWECEARLPNRWRSHAMGVEAYPAEALATMLREMSRLMDGREIPILVRVERLPC